MLGPGMLRAVRAGDPNFEPECTSPRKYNQDSYFAVGYRERLRGDTKQWYDLPLKLLFMTSNHHNLPPKPLTPGSIPLVLRGFPVTKASAACG